MTIGGDQLKDDNIIKFPMNKIILNEDEYREFEEYKEKMINAKTKEEVDYYYSMALSVIKKAKNRYH
jgi:hypothetical protein